VRYRVRITVEDLERHRTVVESTSLALDDLSDAVARASRAAGAAFDFPRLTDAEDLADRLRCAGGENGDLVDIDPPGG